MTGCLDYWIWLSSVPYIGSRKSRQLTAYFGSPENVWNARIEELKKLPFLTRLNVEQLTNKEIKKNLENHLKNMKESDINAISIEDESYPYYLKNIYDPPIVLYVKGKLMKDEKAVAVVGSRRATLYGLKTAEKISYDLSGCGIAVISGMATGIDSYAHKGALDAGGRTIAVAGCGLDIVYPPENKELMHKIIDSGAVISEYLPGFPPIPQNFPARNRIISGISLGVVVIEANDRSGSLITANFALDQGREVFAVPGNINSENSRGTNRLIREGAKIVMGIEDILEELNLTDGMNMPGSIDIGRGFDYNDFSEERMLSGLDKEEKAIAKYLMTESLHIDALAQKSGISMQVINSILIMLELKGVVEQLPGKTYKIRD